MRAEADRFLLLAIHDLRAPLRESTIRAELLKRALTGAMPEAGEAHLLAVLEANRSMDLFLRRLAQFCQAGTDVDRAPKVHVEFLLRQAIDSVGLEAKDPPVQLMTGELPDLSVPAPVQAVFAELLDNALKFNAGPPSIEIRSSRADTEHVFQVRDNGIGFESKFNARIFEPMIRLHGSGTYPGCGFGLAIGRRIVEELGGRLWAESTPDEGSTFYFSLPAA
jgi:light-regulated signal transduction histidine kinase (bacteriophytochrome)